MAKLLCSGTDDSRASCSISRTHDYIRLGQFLVVAGDEEELRSGKAIMDTLDGKRKRAGFCPLAAESVCKRAVSEGLLLIGVQVSPPALLHPPLPSLPPHSTCSLLPPTPNLNSTELTLESQGFPRNLSGPGKESLGKPNKTVD